MSQKPIVMEQLKQILQLKNDGIAIREIARRTGLSRNSVRKYLSLLKADDDSSEGLSNKALADKAYSGDMMEHNAERLHQLLKHFKEGHTELKKTGVTRWRLRSKFTSVSVAKFTTLNDLL